MSRNALIGLIVGAIVVVFAAVVIASSLGSDDEPTHAMPGGGMMDGATMETTTDSGSMGEMGGDSGMGN
jgi:gas vesicle protein